MIHYPTIDMVKTGQNIAKLRKQAGLSVKELQMMFGFATPQAIYKTSLRTCHCGRSGRVAVWFGE